MIEYSEGNTLDTLDKAILDALQTNARISNVDLARQINLSPPAVHARLKRLEQQGRIQQYTAILNRENAGYDMLCFVHLNLQLHQHEQVGIVRTTIQAQGGHP